MHSLSDVQFVCGKMLFVIDNTLSWVGFSVMLSKQKKPLLFMLLELNLKHPTIIFTVVFFLIVWNDVQ